ncbi:hypothetical protein Ancab_013431 [Ancistrocladus abbreviatus]
MASLLISSGFPKIVSPNDNSLRIAFPNSPISKTLIVSNPMGKTSPLSVRSTYNLFLSSHRILDLRCCANSTSPLEFDNSSAARIFIKGLPLSTLELSLSRAFSEYGEVTRVKIMINKRSRQSLGFAYIWFASEESAQLAVKEMDGKFFEGRFVHVTIARPGPSRNRVKAKPYKF